MAILPFLLAPFLASLILTGIHAYLGVHVVEQPRQHLEDRDFGPCAGIDVAEFERDHPSPDKHDARQQPALVQHIVGGDHQLGAGKRQPARRRAGGDHDVLGLQCLTADGNRVRADKAAAVASLNRALEKDPKDLGALYDRARMRLNASDREGAIVDLRKLEQAGFAKGQWRPTDCLGAHS